METKPKKLFGKVLKKVFMVGFSNDTHGEEVVQEVSLFGELKCESQHLLSFIGDEYFDTELEAIQHIEKIGRPACIVQEMFIWKLEENK